MFLGRTGHNFMFLGHKWWLNLHSPEFVVWKKTNTSEGNKKYFQGLLILKILISHKARAWWGISVWVVTSNSLQKIPGWDPPSDTGTCVVVLADNQPWERERFPLFHLHRNHLCPSGCFFLHQECGWCLSTGAGPCPWAAVAACSELL